MANSLEGIQAFSAHLADMSRDKRVSVAKMDRLKELGMALLEHDYELVQAIHALQTAQKPSAFGKIIALYTLDALAQLCARRVRKDKDGKEAAKAAEEGKGSALGFLQFVDGVMDEVVGDIVGNGGVYWAEGLAKTKKILDIWLASSICSRPTVERNLKRVDDAIAQGPRPAAPPATPTASSSKSRSEDHSSRSKRPSSSSQAKPGRSRAPRSSSSAKHGGGRSTTPLDSPPVDLRQRHRAAARSPSLPPLGEEEQEPITKIAQPAPASSPAAESTGNESALQLLLTSLAGAATPAPTSNSPALREPSPAAPPPAAVLSTEPGSDRFSSLASTLQGLQNAPFSTPASSSQAPLAPVPPPKANAGLSFLSQFQAPPNALVSSAAPAQATAPVFNPYGYGQPSAPFFPPPPPPRTLPGFGGQPAMSPPPPMQGGFPAKAGSAGAPDPQAGGAPASFGAAGPSQPRAFVPPPPVLGHIGGARGGPSFRGGFQVGGSGRGGYAGPGAGVGARPWDDGRSPQQPGPGGGGGGGFANGPSGPQLGSYDGGQGSPAAAAPPRGREAAFQADPDHGRRRSRSPPRAGTRDSSLAADVKPILPAAAGPPQGAQHTIPAIADPALQPRPASVGPNGAPAMAPAQTPPSSAGPPAPTAPPSAAPAPNAHPLTLWNYPWNTFALDSNDSWRTLSEAFLATNGRWPTMPELQVIAFSQQAHFGGGGAGMGGGMGGFPMGGGGAQMGQQPHGQGMGGGGAPGSGPQRWA